MSVRERRRIKLNSDEILFLIGSSGELGIVKASRDMHIFIGTPESEEIVMFLEPQDLIAVSAFENGVKAEKGIESMLYLLRELGSPIVVLPKGHPTSKRLPLVVSCGDRVRLDCGIQAGTHPEQDILCACDDLSGVKIAAVEDGVEVEGDFSRFQFKVQTTS
ncbi:hypothetical protein [Methanobacterium aggregans]|uniref:hypothetical protein n=1 Tax=Methanobacterium aggregans TaxID=1615586 RepID=UPI001AE11457|nr:hypothetical protein [Methanobacterium aggregans]